jgi:hypothetical protein
MEMMPMSETLNAIRDQVRDLLSGPRYSTARFRFASDQPWHSAADLLARFDELSDDDVRTLADDILEDREI